MIWGDYLKIKYILLIAILAISFILISLNDEALTPFEHNIKKDKIKSASLSTDYTIDQAISDIEELSLNTVNIPIVVNIDSISSSKMSIDKSSLEKAIQLLSKLKGNNIKIILEAYPWIKNGSEYETKWKPDNMQAFFENWKTILETLVTKVANPYDVEILNIASNFELMENYEDDWCGVIAFVRGIYKGKITYRTSWWYTAKWDLKSKETFNKKLDNKAFAMVDFISVAAYFELSDSDTNSVISLTKALESTTVYNREQNVIKELYDLYTKWNKPIFFGELGFPRTYKAAMQPWNPNASKTLSNEEQAKCFEAYRRIFENEPWILGFSIFAIGEKSQNKLYYPSKESIKIIKRWYSITDEEN